MNAILLFSEVAQKQWSCDSQLPPDPDQEIFRCHVQPRRRQETTHAPTDERGQKDCRVLKHRKLKVCQTDKNSLKKSDQKSVVMAQQQLSGTIVVIIIAVGVQACIIVFIFLKRQVQRSAQKRAFTLKNMHPSWWKLKIELQHNAHTKFAPSFFLANSKRIRRNFWLKLSI